MNFEDLTSCEFRNVVPVVAPTCWNETHQCSLLMKILFYMFVYSRNNLNDLYKICNKSLLRRVCSINVYLHYYQYWRVHDLDIFLSLYPDCYTL